MRAKSLETAMSAVYLSWGVGGEAHSCERRLAMARVADAYTEAYRTGNASDMLELLCDDALFSGTILAQMQELPANSAMVQGRRRIGSFLGSLVPFKKTFETDGRFLTGNMAIYQIQWLDAAGGECRGVLSLRFDGIKIAAHQENESLGHLNH